MSSDPRHEGSPPGHPALQAGTGYSVGLNREPCVSALGPCPEFPSCASTSLDGSGRELRALKEGRAGRRLRPESLPPPAPVASSRLSRGSSAEQQGVHGNAGGHRCPRDAHKLVRESPLSGTRGKRLQTLPYQLGFPNSPSGVSVCFIFRAFSSCFVCLFSGYFQPLSFTPDFGRNGKKPNSDTDQSSPHRGVRAHDLIISTSQPAALFARDLQTQDH